MQVLLYLTSKPSVSSKSVKDLSSKLYSGQLNHRRCKRKQPHQNSCAECSPFRNHVTLLQWIDYLTIILRNRAEYHLILSRRGRRPSWLNQGIFRKIEQDNCFIIQQIQSTTIFRTRKTTALYENTKS